MTFLYFFVNIMMRWIGIVFGLLVGGMAMAQTTGLAQQQTGYLQDAEYTGAVARMYEHQLTRYSDPLLFRPGDALSRQEGAKFFVAYASTILGKTIDTKKYCSFDDLDIADTTLKNAILESCLLSIFKGSQGKFFPRAAMTKAEALTALLRLTSAIPLDETKVPRWYDAHTKAFAGGLTKIITTDLLAHPITRYEIALLLWRTLEIKQHQDDLTALDTSGFFKLQNMTDNCTWLKGAYTGYKSIQGDTMVLFYSGADIHTEQALGYTLYKNSFGNLVVVEGGDNIAVLFHLIGQHEGFTTKTCMLDEEGFLQDVGGQKTIDTTCAWGRVIKTNKTYIYERNGKIGGDASTVFCVDSN